MTLTQEQMKKADRVDLYGMLISGAILALLLLAI